MTTSKEYLTALSEIYNSYDAFYITNKYGDSEECTHAKQFKLLYTVKGDLVQRAVYWIRKNWDCAYRNDEQPAGNPFEYLTEQIYRMFPKEFTEADITELKMREPE